MYYKPEGLAFCCLNSYKEFPFWMIATPYLDGIRSTVCQNVPSTEWDVSALTNQATTAGLNTYFYILIKHCTYSRHTAAVTNNFCNLWQKSCIMACCIKHSKMKQKIIKLGQTKMSSWCTKCVCVYVCVCENYCMHFSQHFKTHQFFFSRLMNMREREWCTYFRMGRLVFITVCHPGGKGLSPKFWMVFVHFKYNLLFFHIFSYGNQWNK